MADAFSPDIFENLFREKGFTEFKCTGIHPWDGTKCNCGAFPKAKQRGASAIYFPSRVSSLIIPLNTSENKERVEDSTTFKTAVEPTTGNVAKSTDSSQSYYEVVITKFATVTIPPVDKNGKIASGDDVSHSNSAMASYYNTKDAADKDIEGDTYISENTATKAS